MKNSIPRVLLEGQEPLIGRPRSNYIPWIKISVQAEDIKRGKRKSYYNCPIGLSLKRHCSPSMIVMVDKNYISIQSKDVDKAGKCSTYFWARTTGKARKFIQDFDKGKTVRPISILLRSSAK